VEPSVVALAGPNGAGKSTAGPGLVRDVLGISEYVDADLLARRTGGTPWTAGRAMLSQLRDLARARRSFAFETTLASRTFAPWIRELKREGWRFEVSFLWLPSPELAASRVEGRVRHGGHGVPEDVVRRRYRAGLVNFFGLYRPLADAWRMYDNSGQRPRLMALGSAGRVDSVEDVEGWARLETDYGRGSEGRAGDL
jgi:predicted ABC-type ATPase